MCQRLAYHPKAFLSPDREAVAEPAIARVLFQPLIWCSARPRSAESPSHQPNRHLPGNPQGSVICNWQRGVISILRLHSFAA